MQRIRTTGQKSYSLSQAGQGRNIAEAACIFLIVVAFVYATRPEELSGNSLSYINTVTGYDWSAPRFRAPHLIHVPTMSLLHKLLSSLWACDVACAAMTQSIMWAGIAISSIYLIAKRLFGFAGAVTLSIAALLSHGFWIFATQVEVYVPAIGAAMAASCLLLTGPSTTKSSAQLIGVAIFWSLATMYHVVNVFLFIPIFVYYHLTQGREGWWQWLITSALAGGIVALCFVGAYVWSEEALSPAGFVTWLFEIANRPLTDWGSVANWTPTDVVRGAWNQIEAIVVWPATLSFGLEYPWYQAPLALLVGSVCFAALAWNAYAAWTKFVFYQERWYFVVLCLLWFLAFTWWDPSVHKFYIHSASALIFLIGFAVHDVARATMFPAARRTITFVVAISIGAMAVLNSFSVRELARSKGPLVVEAGRLAELAPRECVIYTVGQHQNPMELYFGRPGSAFILNIERDFYRTAIGELDRDPDRFGKEPCAFVMLGWLSPQQFERTIARYLPTARWEEYVAYVVDARPAPEGGITLNPVDIIAENGDARYVLIDRRRRVEASGIEEVAERLRAAIDTALAHFPEVRGMEPRLVSTVLSVPWTGFVSPYNRERFFGYSWGDEARQIVNRSKR